METSQSTESQAGLKSGVYHLDDFELEGLGFKPITKGLGFHGEKEKRMATGSSLAKKRDFERPLRGRAANLPNSRQHKSKLQHSPQEMSLGLHETGLKHFYDYKNEEVNSISLKSNTEEKPTRYFDASLTSRLFSYFIDICFVTFISLMLFALFSFLAYENYGMDALKTFFIRNYDFYVLMYFFFYLAYFTLFDGVGTLGKRVCGIVVISKDSRNPVSVIQLFNRATISFFGMALMALPNILDLHSKLSRTNTVKINE